MNAPLLVLVLFALFASPTIARKAKAKAIPAPDPCEFRDNRTAGVCLPVAQCPGAVVELHARHPRLPTTCGFEGKTPIVCCLPAQRNAATAVERPSARACGQFTTDAWTARPQQFALLAEPGTSQINVVGGTRTAPLEYPHMAALGYADNANASSADPVRWLCGGSLISDQWVLTAAHCVRRKRPTVIRIGQHDLAADQGLSEDDHRIDRVVVHPKYNSSRSYDDIALLRLFRPVVRTAKNRPACLWQRTDGSEASMALTATGFGLTEFGGDPSPHLLKVRLDAVPEAECAPKYQNVRKLPAGLRSSQMCAGDSTDKRDTCHGDSGGPLQVMMGRMQYHIVGITSFGRGCAMHTPGVYTRVASYLDWIEGLVWP